MAALGCIPGMLVIAVFLIIGIAVGQHHPPKYEPEDEVVVEMVDDSLAVDIAADSLAVDNEQ